MRIIKSDKNEGDVFKGTKTLDNSEYCSSIIEARRYYHITEYYMADMETIWINKEANSQSSLPFL